MLLHQYEMQFINGVNQTYDMLNELEEVTNDDDFWKVFGNIKTGFRELDDAATKYYAEMRVDGIERPYENCSLTYELLHGTQGLYDKYLAILDKIAEVSAGS
jgi:hypothetical protein